MERKYNIWAFGSYEKDGVPIEGLTYFKLKNYKIYKVELDVYWEVYTI